MSASAEREGAMERDGARRSQSQQLIISSRNRRRANWNCKSCGSGSETGAHVYVGKQLKRGFRRSVADPKGQG